LYEATVEISSEKKVTGSKVVPLTKSLLSWYAEQARCNPEGNFEQSLSSCMLDNLTKRFNLVEDVKELAVGTALAVFAILIIFYFRCIVVVLPQVP